MLKSSIKDPSIAIRPSSKLVDFIKSLDDASIDLPENLLKVYRGFTEDNQKRNVCKKTTVVDYSEDEKQLLEKLNEDSSKNVDLEMCLKSLSLKIADDEEDSLSDTESLSAYESDTTKPVSKNKARLNRAKQRQKILSQLELNLNDLKWLNQYLARARKNDKSVGYLHELIDGSQLILPRNSMIERNPELEKRCQRLKREQEEQTYRMMTQDPEDTIAYQMKMINRQLIAVLQFIFSVVAGFAFGFIGVELIIGNLDFGFRLLLGIICALIIALAEIYFLAKKLNEEIEVVDQSQFDKPMNMENKKEHND